jgi:hypothetical protein
MALKPPSIEKKSLFHKLANFLKKKDTRRPVKTSISGDSNDTESICDTCIDSFCTSCCDLTLENFKEKERIAPVKHTPKYANPHNYYLRSTVKGDTDNRSQATVAAANTDGAIGGQNTPKDTSPSAPTLQSISITHVETPKTSRTTALLNSLAKSPLFPQRFLKTKMESDTQQYTGTRPKTTINDNNDWNTNEHGDSCLCESCYNPARRNTQNVTVGELTSILGDQQKSQTLTLLQGLAPFSGNSIVKGPNAQRFEIWIRTFEAIISMASWDSQKEINLLASKLIGIAAEALDDFLNSHSEEELTYENAKAHLMNHFHGTETREMYEKEYRKCLREAGESILDYAHRLNRNFQHTYPIPDEQRASPDVIALRDQLLKDKFFSGYPLNSETA